MSMDHDYYDAYTYMKDGCMDMGGFDVSPGKDDDHDDVSALLMVLLNFKPWKL